MLARTPSKVRRAFNHPIGVSSRFPLVVSFIYREGFSSDEDFDQNELAFPMDMGEGLVVPFSHVDVPVRNFVDELVESYPSVAAATFLPKSLKFWDPSFPFKAALTPFDP